MEDLERLKSLISQACLLINTSVADVTKRNSKQKKRTSDLQESLIQSGHSYAMAEAASAFSHAHVIIIHPCA